MELIDLMAIGDLPETIGCPDCADGGGEWIQVFTPMGEARVTFPFGDNVDSISPLLKKIRDMRDRFEVPEIREPKPENPDEEPEPPIDFPPIPLPLPLPVDGEGIAAAPELVDPEE